MSCTCCRSESWSPRSSRTCAEPFPGVLECGQRSCPSNSIPPPLTTLSASSITLRNCCSACWPGTLAHHRHQRGRSLHPNPEIRFRRSTNGGALRHRLLSPSAPRVLRPRPGRCLARPAPAQRIRSRTRSHLPSPPLPGLSLRHGLSPCRGMDRSARKRILRVLPIPGGVGRSLWPVLQRAKSLLAVVHFPP